ncbi:MAG: metal-dependent transcriptional regulator [Clostridiales bacterium]|nr:metal-dependent transcriptional regulator [Clostridiales bacterium]
MHSNKTNESQEDYLESIFVITQRKGFCRSIDIAKELKVSKASVSVAMSKLQNDGCLYMDDDYTLHLTELGVQIAQKVYEKHLTLKEMLEKIGVDPILAEQEACRMEHIISDDTVLKIKSAIKNKA